MSREKYTFYEFFAGGGMARAGLGENFACVFANDFDPMKGATYVANWGAGHFVLEDVAKIRAGDLPGRASLAWASFPCQDLSLAGAYRGLGTGAAPTRSGTFWPFWALMTTLVKERRAPKVIVLENVHGVLTSNGGADFAALGGAMAEAGYRFGAMVIDAKRFLPQSRQRVFFIAVAPEVALAGDLIADAPGADWHPPALQRAHAGLAPAVRAKWLWWRMEAPPARNAGFADLIEEEPTGVGWHGPVETQRLLDLMSDVNLAKVEAAKKAGRRVVGAIYRRTRRDGNGVRRQRAEARFDDVAGCLRTPGGGSSRQTIIVVEGETVRTRLLSAREAARLMGLDDSYRLPARYNDAYHVAGDGVCAPVVRHVAEALIEPILAANVAPGLLAAE